MMEIPKSIFLEPIGIKFESNQFFKSRIQHVSFFKCMICASLGLIIGWIPWNVYILEKYTPDSFSPAILALTIRRYSRGFRCKRTPAFNIEILIYSYLRIT